LHLAELVLEQPLDCVTLHARPDPERGWLKEAAVHPELADDIARYSRGRLQVVMGPGHLNPEEDLLRRSATQGHLDLREQLFLGRSVPFFERLGADQPQR